MLALCTDLKVADNEANTSDDGVKIQIPTSNVSSIVMHQIVTYLSNWRNRTSQSIKRGHKANAHNLKK